MNFWPLVLLLENAPAELRSLEDMLNCDYRIKLANAAQAVKVAQTRPQPDLILLDVLLPDMDGLELCRQFKASEATRHIPVVFITAINDPATEVRAMQLQAADYITKPYSLPVARARIRNTLYASRKQGKPAPASGSRATELPPRVVQAEGSGQVLGKRQTEVLRLIAEGMTSAEIGQQLSIAKGTVEVHRENIMRKLGVRNIAGLVKCAIRHGLMEP